jgi:hypothetical protein
LADLIMEASNAGCAVDYAMVIVDCWTRRHAHTEQADPALANPTDGLQRPSMADLLGSFALTPQQRGDVVQAWHRTEATCREPVIVAPGVSLPATPEWDEARAAARAWGRAIGDADRQERERQRMESVLAALPRTRSERSRWLDAFSAWCRVWVDRRRSAAAAVQAQRAKRYPIQET